jgi:magnesium-transporting ATPase (P-type)
MNLAHNIHIESVTLMFIYFRLDVIGLHEFDSVRKRMSVVVRFPNNRVQVLVKGADSSMLSILRYRKRAQQSLAEQDSTGHREPLN